MTAISLVAPPALRKECGESNPDAAEVTGAYLVRIRPLELRTKLRNISTDRFVLGRDSTSQLQISDESVSRFHAVIEHSANGYEITDLHSTNGLFINERRVSKSAIINGDQIRLGDQVFKFLSAEHVEAERHADSDFAKTHDGLTGLPKRRYFADAIEREVEDASEWRRPFSIACLDLDHLAAVNEHRGRMAGDEILLEFAQRVTCAIPGDAILARLGGDEFGVLFYDCGLQNAQAICERVRAAVSARPFTTAACAIPVTVSIGVASAADGDFDAETLAATADALLLESKRHGRNRTTARELAPSRAACGAEA